MVDQSLSPAARSGGDAPILVSGASFAGLASAFWLERLGYRVTVVELASGLRKGGTPVDIEGETVDILLRMGLLDAVLKKTLPPRNFAFKDVDDATLGSFGPVSPDDDPSGRYEIHRDDLLDILFAAVGGSVEWRFGQSITGLEDGADGVAVTFSDGTSGDYALVLGCDGNRSNTRRLAFGDAAGASYFMGGYVYLKVVRETGLLPANMSQVFSAPGRSAMLNGYDDRTDICLGFRTDGEIDYDYRNREQQQRLVHEHLDGLGWKVPEMLAHVDVGGDFYFDRVSQIRMPHWSIGRVALVGDAGYCVSPLAGLGGSMAIIGAARLGDAMRQHPDDHTVAFRDYEDKLRPFVEQVQERAAAEGMSRMMPATEEELVERNRRLRAGDLEM